MNGQFAYVKNYDLSLTNRGEASSVKLSIPLEGIDTKVFTETANKDKYVEVQIYSGYLLDNVDKNNQISEFLAIIQADRVTSQSRFCNRFDGFVAQPEWIFGMERTLNLTCFDWSQILREWKWEANFKDGDCEVRRVIQLLQDRITGIKIQADPYPGTLKLGEVDQESKKQSYNASGKTFFEVLEECAKKMNKNIIVKGKNIFITQYKEQPVIWNFYYGAKDAPEYKGQENATPFETVTLRYGEVGEVQKTGVVVDLYSRTLSKKGKASTTKVRFPENSTVSSLSKHVSRTLKNNLSESELKVLAENIYKRESKKVMTGNADLKFANPFIDLYDLVTFITDQNNQDLAYMKDVNFSINSITETYSVDGYEQKIDFDSSLDATGTLRKQIAPTKIVSQQFPGKMRQIGYAPIYIGDTSVLNKPL